MINTFRDLLLTTHFDCFRNLLSEIDELKSELKKLKRRVKPPLGIMSSYSPVLSIASNLNKVFKGKRHSRETTLELFKEALNSLQTLVRELAYFDWEQSCTSLAATLQHLYDRLFVLLPKDTPLQLELFNVDRYQSSSNKEAAAPKTKGFIDWLLDYTAKGFIRRDRIRAGNRVIVNVAQFSLRLRA